MINKKIPFLTGLLALVVTAGALFGSGGLFNLSLGLENLTSAPKAGEITFTRTSTNYGKIKNTNKYYIEGRSSGGLPIYLIGKTSVDMANEGSGCIAVFQGTFDGGDKSIPTELYFSTNKDGTDIFRFQSVNKISMRTNKTTANKNIDFITTSYGVDSSTQVACTTTTGDLEVQNIQYLQFKSNIEPNAKFIKTLTICYDCINSYDYTSLDSITVNPSKTTFQYGENFKFEGSIIAHYADGTDSDVTNSEQRIRIDKNNFDPYSHNEEYTIDVYFTDGFEAHDSYVVSVGETSLSSIEVTNAITRFAKGATFEGPSEVIAHYTDGSSAPITGYTFSEPDMTTLGSKTVNVSYTESGKTCNTNYDITVYELSSISLNTDNVKKEFNINESFNYEGLIVDAHYSDDTTDEGVTGFTVSTPDMTTAGEKTVTVSYTDEAGTTKTTTYTINVKGEPPIGDKVFVYHGTWADYTLTLNGDGTGTYTCSTDTNVICFTWSQSGNNVTFTYVSGDETNFGNYQMFKTDGSLPEKQTSCFDGESFKLCVTNNAQGFLYKEQVITMVVPE